jgi:hypothetical protein
VSRERLMDTQGSGAAAKEHEEAFTAETRRYAEKRKAGKVMDGKNMKYG